MKGRIAAPPRGQLRGVRRYGLQRLDRGGSAPLHQAARIAMTRQIQRGGKSGSGSPGQRSRRSRSRSAWARARQPGGWVAVVRPGRIMFELEGVEPEVASGAAVAAASSVKCKSSARAPRGAAAAGECGMKVTRSASDRRLRSGRSSAPRRALTAALPLGHQQLRTRRCASPQTFAVKTVQRERELQNQGSTHERREPSPAAAGARPRKTRVGTVVSASGQDGGGARERRYRTRTASRSRAAEVPCPRRVRTSTTPATCEITETAALQVSGGACRSGGAAR